MTDRDVITAACVLNPDEHAPRLALADCVTEEGDEVLGHVIRAQVQYGLPLATTPVRDVTLEELVDSYDWREVFGVGGGGNCTDETDAIPPGAAVDTTPPKIEDVVEIYAAVNGENDESDWVGLFRVRDGRFVVAYGGCDYTGWDCRASNQIEVASTAADVVHLGLDKDQLARLWEAR